MDHLPTEGQFKRFCKVQNGGHYNMITEAAAAAAEAGLSMDEYKSIIKNYSTLSTMYPNAK